MDLGVDLLEYSESLQAAITIILTEYYGKDGYDWISWYLYEKPTRTDENDHHAWDANGNPICYDPLSLWTQVEEIRKRIQSDELEINLTKLFNDQL
jgi:hypothetical protein